MKEKEREFSQNLDGESSVVNFTQFFFDERVVLEILKEILEGENRGKKVVSVVLIDSLKMKELNRIYRKKDYVTDVLSFFYNEEDLLGEIVLCPEKIKENVKKEDFTKEFYRVTIHGALHLLGYDHLNDEDERVMNKKTEHYLKIFLKKL